MAQIVSDRAQGRKKRHASKVCEGTVGCRIWQWISVCFMVAKWRGYERTSKSAKGPGRHPLPIPKFMGPSSSWWDLVGLAEFWWVLWVFRWFAFLSVLRESKGLRFQGLEDHWKVFSALNVQGLRPRQRYHRVWVGSDWKIHWRLGCSPRVPLREKNLRLLQCLLSRQVMTAQHSAQKSTLGMPHQSQSLIKFCLGRSLWGTGWFAGVLWPFTCWYMFRSKVLNNSHRL